MLLEHKIEDGLIEVDNKLFSIIDDNENLFTEDLTSIARDLEEGLDGFVYEFGGRFYYQLANKDLSLDELVYVGKAKQKIATKSFLGIHSGYELMNGVGLYKDWIKKAKFLGIETLAICEKSALSGALVFQTECKSKGIKSIIGMTVPIINDNLASYEIKLYTKDFKGWLNLLKINSILNVEKKTAVEINFLEDNCEGLFIVVDPKSMEFKNCPEFADFYQLDTVKFLNQEKDEWYLNNLEKFMLSEIKPISICDAYYLEKRDVEIREALWNISKAYDDRTDNQFFKNKDKYAEELIAMFESGNKSWLPLFKEATKNESYLAEACNFNYDTDTRHLPRYEMTAEESEKYSSNYQLFMGLIKKGFKDRGIKDAQKYLDRLKIEIDVLKMGDVVDYFLSLHDILGFAKRENILTGIGRGSAGGSLVAYLLGIIQVNPLEFDLLFERFLNSGRMGLWEDRPAYVVELEDGKVIELAEGSLVRIKRGEQETVVLIDELKEEDEIIKY
jgi:DNA polymerase-3 subunit alpha